MTPKRGFDLAPGLLDYCNSQADLMLTQFYNIKRLLGPSTDWTASGDLCEILLTDFLRRFLPPSFTADKGFVYGRTSIEGKDIHSPEIDILVHDTQRFRPLFRIGDFVIVQPQSVRAMIQVKRTLTGNQVSKGLRNVVVAKQHLLNVLWRDEPIGWDGWPIPPRIFAAIVGFEDKLGNSSAFHQKCLPVVEETTGL